VFGFLCSVLGNEGSGFRVQGLRLRVSGSGFRIQDSRFITFRVYKVGLGFNLTSDREPITGLWVQDLGFRV